MLRARVLNQETPYMYQRDDCAEQCGKYADWKSPIFTVRH
jgi:hypothetical protein